MTGVKWSDLSPLGVALLLLGSAPALAQPADTLPAVEAPALPALEPFAAAMQSLETDEVKAAVDQLGPLVEAGDPRAMFALAVLHDLGAGVRIDHERAGVLLERAATAGFSPAIHYLAWKHKVGFGVADETPAEEVERITRRAEQAPHVESGVPARWLGSRDGEPAPAFGRAFGWMIKASNRSDLTAMLNLATVYLGGPWTRAEPFAHVAWLRKAAEAGDGPSARRLSMYYGLGLIVAEDPKESALWLRRAAEAGDVDSQYSLARDIARGRGGQTRDPREAARWYERAAEQGHVKAMLEFGRLLRDGEVVPQDYARACRLFQAAADQGDADGYAELGWMIERGKGTPRDLRRARDAFRKALELGDDWAGRALGDVLREPEFAPTPWDEVIAAYRLGAERGSETAMNALGALYYDGTGVSRDRAEAFLWYERAARSGHAWAQNRVGWMLREGIGIERDDEEAVSWFRLSAAQGELLARANLGYHLSEGRGVARDPVAACEHLVAGLGSSDSRWAGRVLKSLLASASAEELAAMRPHLVPVFSEVPAPAPPVAQLAISLLFDGPEGLRDPEAARVRLERLAEAGDVEALADACLRSYAGHGLPFDLGAARDWARRLGALRPARGAILEARIDLLEGDDTTREAARATLDRLAGEGDREANQILGYACATGEGLPVDFDRAWRCVEALAAQRMPEAVAALATKAGDPRAGLRRFFGAVADPMPDPAAMAVLVARHQESHPQPDARPTPLHTPAPHYPRVLKSAGITGRVDVEIVVGVDGRPEKVDIVEASHPLFAIAAEAAIQRWWFAPGRVAGEPVHAKVRQVLAFTLPGGEE